jgi:hypothetical protein
MGPIGTATSTNVANLLHRLLLLVVLVVVDLSQTIFTPSHPRSSHPVTPDSGPHISMSATRTLIDHARTDPALTYCRPYVSGRGGADPLQDQRWHHVERLIEDVFESIRVGSSVNAGY